MENVNGNDEQIKENGGEIVTDEIENIKLRSSVTKICTIRFFYSELHSPDYECHVYLLCLPLSYSVR